MSTKKQNLIGQLRFHYQKKFGDIPQIQNLLEVGLAKLNEKEKISANVINSYFLASHLFTFSRI